MSEQDDLTMMLEAWSNGDKQALDQLMPLVYQELRRLAGRYLRKERPGHTIQTTALVHEAYLRLIDQDRVRWQSRAHFFAVAAQMMRRILVNYARDQHAAKRGGSDQCKLALDEALAISNERAVDLTALDDALNLLAEKDQRKSSLVELRFFSGLSIEEAATVLGISVATAKRDWLVARAWLFQQISNQDKDTASC